MDATSLTIVWIVGIGIIVALAVWLGPRPSQWRSHGGEDDEKDREQDEPPPD